MGFREALDEHLAAIVARDIDRFAATISHCADVRVIGPDGGEIVGYDAIVAAHRGWFGSESAWTFVPRVALERASESLGFALLEVEYREADTERRFLLSVIFTREDGTWKFLYDQNTTRALGHSAL